MTTALLWIAVPVGLWILLRFVAREALVILACLSTGEVPDEWLGISGEVVTRE